VTLRVNDLRVDAADPSALAKFWLRALDWHLVFGSTDEMLIAASPGRPLPAGSMAILFRRTTAAVDHARWMFDLAPTDQAADVARLEALGARQVDVDLGDSRWIAMEDPEGNRFCVLHEVGTLPQIRTY
jgi:hypothetical protein